MKVVSVINYKGGVGKTTITANIAAFVASKGKRVLMIDLDPQANLTFSFINNVIWEETYAENKTLKNFFQPVIRENPQKISLDSIIIPIEVDGIKMGLISSHLELISIDTDLAACLGGPNLYILNRNFLKTHNILRKGITDLRSRYDLVLIDCPPNFNTVVKNALASDFYLVPAKMDYLSTFGIEQLNKNSEDFVKEHNQCVASVKDNTFTEISPRMLGVVPTMISIYGGEPIQNNQHFINRVKQDHYHLFPYLRENTNIHSMAPLRGVPVILSEKTNPAVVGVVEELENLSQKFMEKVGI